MPPDLVARLEEARREPVAQGYQRLPRLLPDAPPEKRPLARPSAYSWPWTETMIEREQPKIERLESVEFLAGPQAPPPARAALERIVADFAALAERQRTIDAHVQYNRSRRRAPLPACYRARPAPPDRHHSSSYGHRG